MREKQIIEIKECIDSVYGADCAYFDVDGFAIADKIYNAGYRKQSEVIDEFVDKLKEAPIKCGLPLLGLSTKEEVEEYFNGIMLQVRDAIDRIAKELKGGAE